MLQNLILLVVVGALVVAGAVRYAWDSAVLRKALEERMGQSAPVCERLRMAFDDAMPLKDSLSRIRNCGKFAVFGTTGHPYLGAGRDGFIMWNDFETATSFRRAKLLTAEQLELWRDALQERSDWVNAHGSEYAFMLAPDKFTIYGDKAPLSLKQSGKKSRADQFVEYMRTHSTVRVIDLRDALRARRNEGLLYYRTDTHWNDLGAYYAYREILRNVPPLDQTRPLELAQFRRVERQFDFGDTVKVAGVYSFARDIQPFLIPLTPPAFRIAADSVARALPNVDAYAILRVTDPIVTEVTSDLPRVLLFHDSFGVGLQRYLSNNAGRIKYVWHGDLNPEDVEREHPDVVIQEMTERFLVDPPLRASRLRGVPRRKLFDLDESALPLRLYSCRLDGNRLTTYGADSNMVIPGGYVSKTDKLLDVDFDSPEAIRMQLFWTTTAHSEFSEENMTILFAQPGRHLLRFSVPPEACTLRLDPGDYSGVYKLRSIKLYDVN